MNGRLQLTEQVQQLNERIAAHVTQIDELKSDVAQLRRAFRSQASKTQRLLPPRLAERMRVTNRLARIAAGNRPIVVGPWTGEVGYELLYWVPFVRWFVRQYRVHPRRLRVVSRGGPVSWYGDLATQYADVLSFLSPDEFRQREGARAWMKQDQVTGFDRQILRRLLPAFGGGRFSLLHPSLMYPLFKGYWGARTALNEMLGAMEHVRLRPPSAIPSLPRKYVAVRFYFRSSFPDTPDNRAVVSRTLAALTANSDVVVLNPGFRVDDHDDCGVERSDRIHTIDHLLTPERNLDVQTAAIAHAEAFVGSYGGYSYLAPLFGVPSLAFYSVKTFKTCHLELAEHVFDRIGGGTLTVVNTADVDLLGAPLAGMHPWPGES